jgi:hypothetical protein
MKKLVRRDKFVALRIVGAIAMCATAALLRRWV